MKPTALHCLITITFCLFAFSAADAKQPKHGPVNVNVTNPISDPVPVTIQGHVTTHNGDTAVQPYDQFDNTQIDNGLSGSTIAFNVPAGKRLVIESVTVYAALPSGENIWQVGMSTTNNNQSISHTIAVTPQGQDDNGLVRFSGTFALRSFSDAGPTSVTFIFSRNSTTGLGFAGASLSGYLLDVPATTSSPQ